MNYITGFGIKATEKIIVQISFPVHCRSQEAEDFLINFEDIGEPRGICITLWMHTV